MNDTQAAVVAGAAFVWMLSSIWANVQLILERRAHSKERQVLLDRIMARTYQEYVYANKADDNSDTNQLTTDEIEAKWYEAKQREMTGEDIAEVDGVGL